MNSYDSITDVPGIKVGHYTDLDAATAAVDLDDFADFKELRHPIR